jgi:subtilisin family serine protease
VARPAAFCFVSPVIREVPAISGFALAAALAAAPGTAAAALVSQGAFRIGADAYWSRGLTGSGETVAVLDLGFAGLDASIAAGELPPRERLVLRSFDAEFGLDGRSAVGARTEHGVRMAEIVHDLAPAATLVLVNYHTQGEFEQAVEWLVANQIPIVSHSNSFLTSPHDGTGRAARAVDRAAAAGVLWVNSAGNYAQRHWSGRLGPTPTVLPLSPRPGEVLQFAAGWTGAPAAQVELAVERRAAGGEWSAAARSGPDPEAQPRVDGAASALTPPVAADTGEWRLVARAVTGGEVAAEIFSRSVTFGSHSVAASSVMTPGDAAGALTVGAVPWTGSELAPYSSQGPTDDGRLKPDLVAPTYVTSNPDWPGTAGTSAAAPHVAAAAALLRQARRQSGRPAGPAELREDLRRRALDLGPPGADPLFGAGLARLDTSPPRVRVRIGRGLRPVLYIRVSDDGTVGTVRVRYRGREIAVRTGPRPSVRLPALRRGRNRVEVLASDLAGNVGRLARTVIRGTR